MPTPYFHVVFTLPEELRAVVATNREQLFGMLFDAASKVIARLFRRLFRDLLLRAVELGHVKLAARLVEPMRRALFEKKWVVYAKAPFGGAEQVYSYLGRYTHRVGISNARIRGADARGVTFATKNGRTCTLEPVEFLRRFLLHVLPKGFHKIRHYGLCSNHHIGADTLIKVRALLQPTPPIALVESTPAPPSAVEGSESRTPDSWIDCMLALAGVDVLRCPRCEHGRMLRVPLELAELGATRDEDTS